jgi:hypothetical protein
MVNAPSGRPYEPFEVIIVAVVGTPWQGVRRRAAPASGNILKFCQNPFSAAITIGAPSLKFLTHPTPLSLLECRFLSRYNDHVLA